MFQVFRLPWNKTVSQRGLASLARFEGHKYTQYIEINGRVHKFNTIISKNLYKILLFHIVGFCPLFMLWDFVLWDSVPDSNAPFEFGFRAGSCSTENR